MRKPSTATSCSVTPEKLAELKVTAEKILANCRQTMLSRQPFVGTVAMSLNLKPVRDKRLDTAATDGTNIYFDIDFLSRLTNDERIFVIAHEVWHNVLNHSLRRESRDAEIFNLAADIEVNELLIADGFVIPKDGLTAKFYGFTPGSSAEEYYEKLLAKQKYVYTQSNTSNGTCGNGPADKACGNGTADDNGQCTAEINPTCGQQFDKHIYKDDRPELEAGLENADDKYGKVDIDADYMPNVTEHALEKIRESAISAAQTIQKQCGSIPGHIQTLIESLLEPKMPWKELLAQFVTKCNGAKPNWNVPNRRYAYAKTYLPSRINDALNIVIGLDASGSTLSDMPEFLSEVSGLLNSFSEYNLNLIEGDTRVCKHEVYTMDNPLVIKDNTYQTSGGGGTELHCIFKYIEQNNVDTDAIIIFTDGENSTDFEVEEMPAVPVLWVISKGGTDKRIKYGQVIKLA
jgi:predicted metal-dependent peptidase